jgi:hypothetical protein
LLVVAAAAELQTESQIDLAVVAVVADLEHQLLVNLRAEEHPQNLH